MKGWTAADIDKLKVAKPGALKQTPMNKLFALGRLKGGEMNKTEAAYAKLLELKKHTGDVLWYAFEPVNLRIAKKCFYAVDFMVLTKEGYLECHEVKGGYIMDDALIKTKAAAEKFPFRFIIVRLIKGNWDIREF